MENKVNVEQIMQEIYAQAANQPAYEPDATFSSQEFDTKNKFQVTVVRVGRKVKNGGKKAFGKFVRIFVAMYLFAKSQLASGKNVILDNAEKTKELSGYVHGDLEKRLIVLEEANARLQEELEQLKAAGTVGGASGRAK